MSAPSTAPTTCRWWTAVTSTRSVRCPGRPTCYRASATERSQHQHHPRPAAVAVRAGRCPERRWRPADPDPARLPMRLRLRAPQRPHPDPRDPGAARPRHDRPGDDLRQALPRPVHHRLPQGHARPLPRRLRPRREPGTRAGWSAWAAVAPNPRRAPCPSSAGCSPATPAPWCVPASTANPPARSLPANSRSNGSAPPCCARKNSAATPPKPSKPRQPAELSRCSEPPSRLAVVLRRRRRRSVGLSR